MVRKELLVLGFASTAVGFTLGRLASRPAREPLRVTSTLRGGAATGQGRVAVVTGGSRGIGAAVCKILAKQGYKVVVNYRSNADMAAAVVADIEKEGGVAVAVQADIAVEADVQRLFAETRRLLGPVAALVNNAAIIGPRGSLTGDDAVDDWAAELRTLIETNVVSAMGCIKEAVADMSTARGGSGGSIVSVSSGSAMIGSPLLYGVSKGALNSVQNGLVKELAAQGVRINSVAPGMTKTDMVPDDVAARNKGTIPLGRVGEPEEIAATIAFLLGDESSYTSGACIRVAGGRPMGGLQ